MSSYDGFIFDFFSIIFSTIFFIVVFIIIIAFTKIVSQWSYNNKQPIIDVNSKVISKRSKVSKTLGHTSSKGLLHLGKSSTGYYITFEVECGDRIEFKVSTKDYGIIAEKDIGTLTFQGIRFLGFRRKL